MKITFHPQNFKSINPTDLVSFIEDLSAKDDNSGANYYAYDTKITDDQDSDKMCNVIINFQKWEQGKLVGMGQKMEFKNYRAKDFSCQNKSFRTIPNTY